MGTFKNHLSQAWIRSLPVSINTPTKLVENNTAKILWDLMIQTDKQLLANQSGIVVVHMEQKTAFMIDVAVPAGSNIRKKAHGKTKK